MRYKFPKQARLRRSEQFRRVYRRGQRHSVGPLFARLLLRQDVADAERNGKRSRLGLSIGKRVGGAVVRNRWKRAIREAFRLHRHRLPVPCDLVIGVRWEARDSEVEKVEEAFLQLVELVALKVR